MWPKIVIWIVSGLIVAAAVTVVVGRTLWQTHARSLVEELASVAVTPEEKGVTAAQRDATPQPVQRYLAAVLADSQPRVTAARIEHSGTFNMGTTEDRWLAFTSVQDVVPGAPGFVWNARIAMMPGIPARVLDAYVGERGVLTARLFGLIPVMELPETPEVAQSELMRFLAEAAWYPTALLPGAGVTWEAVDDSSARATLVDGSVQVSVEVRFGADGLIESVYSDGRYRDVDGEQVATPWEGRFWNYQERSRMLIPLDGEVAWILPDGPKLYWRGHIEAITYRFSR